MVRRRAHVDNGARRAYGRSSPTFPAAVPRLPAILIDGLRAALFRHPRVASTTVGAGVFVGVIVVYLLASILIGMADTTPPWMLLPGGVLTVLCDSMLTLIAAWLLAVLAARREAVWGIASVLLAATVATAVVVHWPVGELAVYLARHGHGALALLAELAGRCWWFFVLLVFSHWLAPRGLGHALGSAVLAYAISAASWWWLPQSPLIRTMPTVQADAGEAGRGDAGNGVDATVDPDEGSSDTTTASTAFDAEAAMYAQPALLDAALAKLKPQTPGKVDLYVVAFAGDAQEDVFRNEAEYVETLFARRFGAEGRTVVLENHAATVTTRPLASWTNLQRTLAAVARTMDPAEDVLLLYITTHGSDDHQLLVDLDPLPLNQIGPEDIADALKTTPAMRWKVIVVNACYSGGYIDALRDDSTMVLTSARADRTSFGCGADSDITYFGKAFLAEALNRTTSLREAFDLARASVDAWETADQKDAKAASKDDADAGAEPILHSEPQIATSASIEARLAAWRRTLHEAPAVPFTPASEGAPP
ncbi:peptidase C13-like protein [Dokdonella fugitiva]|uniref:Peptidase C13-like protein n=1 Tax=Dokdonella fugitiva TaxID=328517 RepID=A0A4V6NNE3_9GAMM|nr:peptidase C13-like protein [Dokdonella fugitiva]